MHRVFISYSRDNSHGQKLAVEIETYLGRGGFYVFRDEESLKPGDIWYKKIESELKNSHTVILILTEAAKHSNWVHNEFSLASERKIPVIPLKAEENISPPLWLRHIQLLDFYKSKESWGCLRKVLNTYVVKKAPKPGTDLTKNLQFSDNVQVIKSAKGKAPPKVNNDVGFEIEKPCWSSEFGRDSYGYYSDLIIGNVVQRFRRIKPGTFWMGSPNTELGRFGEYEARHKVVLEKPFWLADTACTLELWEIVTNRNPSYFDDDVDNPVEGVSWHDVQEFIQKINSKVES